MSIIMRRRDFYGDDGHFICHKSFLILPWRNFSVTRVTFPTKRLTLHPQLEHDGRGFIHLGLECSDQLLELSLPGA